jgi:DNA polymerase III delta prime subunit
MSEDPKKVSKNDLRNSQFGGGFIDADTVNADRIGGDIYNVFLNQQPTLTPQECRNRQALLTKVKNFWIKGVLEKSLYNQVLIELGLEERPDAIANPWNVIIETGDSWSQPLPKGTKVINIFDQIGEGRTLLILGEPGAGKTTTLLELTRDLIARAEQDVNLLIPVVFNLSSWANKRQKIADWLVEELNSKYDVPKKFGQAWVTKQQLLPLLDGLDEVKAQYQDDCIAALNQFKQGYGAELVVCSRIKDYKALSNRLNFQSAVFLRSLTLEQICCYLDSTDADLTGLRALIERDTVLQELAQSPLMLNIMTLAYQGIAVEDLPKTDVVEERRKQLFDDYIEKMFKRRKANQRYSKRQVKHWLIWLAQRMLSQSQTVFLIEYIQPYLLPTSFQQKIYLVSLHLNLGFLLGLLLSFNVNVSGDNFISGLIIRVGFGLLSGISFSILAIVLALLNLGIDEFINPITSIGWSWLYPRNILKIVFSTDFALLISRHIIHTAKLCLAISLIIFLVLWIREDIAYLFAIFKPNLLLYFLIILILVTLIGDLLLIVTLGLTRTERGESTAPNQGIRVSAKTAVTFTLLSTLAIWLIPSVWSDSLQGLGIALGTMIGMACGGLTCIQHFTLRLILYFNNYIPWNYAHFLDYATDRIFLQKVGGGYIFIHRMLMEHFAQMELER